MGQGTSGGDHLEKGRPRALAAYIALRAHVSPPGSNAISAGVIAPSTTWCPRRIWRGGTGRGPAAGLVRNGVAAGHIEESRGFDFLGYQFTPSGLAVAAKTVERFALRWTRLYERGAAESRIGSYVQYWRRWVTGGLGTWQQDVEALVITAHCITPLSGPDFVS